MTYTELEKEQGRDLDYKIAAARKAISAGLEVCRHRPALAFSGGKDSTVLWHLFRTSFPEWNDRLAVIYGNTGVEYPESLKFARKLGRDWAGMNFHEAVPQRTETESLKYSAQREVLQYLKDNGRLGEVLQDDGKLKTTATLEAACPREMLDRFRRDRLVWPAGTRQSYFWCVDQYGWPLLGKAFSKLMAHRINIDCFLAYGSSKSDDPTLLAYYDILREVKISQACCHLLKKEPSERLQAELDIDVVFKGLMAAESRSRRINFTSRGYLFKSSRDHLETDPFYHCNPLSIWTDEDIWAYIKRFDVPYSQLYDMGWRDEAGQFHKIKRNGCMGCGTDLLFPNNHMAMLRRTHPQQWRAFMGNGMGDEIRKLQQAKRNGQVSLMDVYKTDELLDNRPCIFDRIDRLIMFDETAMDGIMEYDPEEVV